MQTKTWMAIASLLSSSLLILAATGELEVDREVNGASIRYVSGEGGRIEGTVIDEYGDFLFDAYIFAIETRQGTHVRSFFSGRYSLTNLEPGFHTIRVNALGYKAAILDSLYVSPDKTVWINWLLEEEILHYDMDDTVETRP